MKEQNTLSQIFETEPLRWGLRGDPYLWREMKQVLGDHQFPSTEGAFIHLIEQTYERLTGISIQELEPFYVERYSHGGMSSGYIDPKFWKESGLPILRERYREAAHR